MEDRSPRVAALCPRRSGKSFACCVRLLQTALETPNATVVYITLTLQQATQNIWGLLKKFNKGWVGTDENGRDIFDPEKELDAKFNETKREIVLPNESYIRLVGASDRGAGEKLRGGTYALVIIDECKSFRPAVLQELIDEVLTPALYDYISPDGITGGTLAMIGTPGNVLAGPFYEATTGKDKSWSFHGWTVADNTAMPHIWQGMLRDKEARGVDDDEPRWQREYLGKWIPSAELAVFHYDKALTSNELDREHDWTHVLGIFLGVDGTFAATAIAYSETNPTLHVVWDIREYQLSLTESAKIIHQAAKRFSPDVTRVYTAEFGKSLVSRLNIHYDLELLPGDGEHFSLVELVNTDLRDGLISIYPGAHIMDEMKLLQWNDEGKTSWCKDTPSECCQAFLYIWDEAQHRFFNEKERELTYKEKVLVAERESLDKMARRRDRTWRDYDGFA